MSSIISQILYATDFLEKKSCLEVLNCKDLIWVKFLTPYLLKIEFVCGLNTL